MIEVKERIVVDGAPQTVWEIVSDPKAVASCIAGCELGEQRDDGSCDATIGVKFGGIRVKFRVLVQLDVDDETMTGQLRITGADQQGATRIGGSANFEVRELDAAQSAVELDGGLTINGKLATLIASGANVVVARMTREFTECLTTKLALTTAPVQPVNSGATTTPMATATVERTVPPRSPSTTTTPAPRSWLARLRDLWTTFIGRLRSPKGKH